MFSEFLRLGSGEARVTDAPLVSVIVPVYNVAPYLRDCLVSLDEQTLDSLEVLLIDDGSTDDSAAIIAELVHARPERFLAFTKPNGGLSSARNHGIDRARGRYIGFVDGDDVIEPDMFALLAEKAVACDAEVVIGGLESWDPETGERFVFGSARATDYGTSLAGVTGSLAEVTPSACNKLFARGLFEQGELRFPEGLRYEDLALVFRLMARATRIDVVERVLYHYRSHRAGSIMTTDFEGYLDLPKAFALLVRGLRADGSFDPLAVQIAAVGALHLFVGRYADFFPRAPRNIRRRYLPAAWAEITAAVPGWREALADSSLWPSSMCRLVTTRRTLLGWYTALPPKLQLRASKRLGMFARPGQPGAGELLD